MDWKKIKGKISSGWKKMMTGVVRFLDPRLEKYRPASEPKEPEPPEIFTPESLEDLFWILKKTPSGVLSKEERELIVAAMTFNERRVKDVMLKKSKMVMVDEDEVLGPLVLDKLYKSGYSHFPVRRKNGEIIGVLHTESLNSLEIKNTDTAKKYMDPQVYFVRNDYTLEQAMAAFLRTNCYFFIVVNKKAEVVGMTSFEELIKLLLGYVPEDTFTGDGNARTVAER